MLVSGYRHGTGAFDVHLGAAYNGEPSFEHKTKDVDALVGFTPDQMHDAGSSAYEGQAFALRFQPSSRKRSCSSIMVDLYDAEGADGPQRGYTLTSISLLVGLHKGTRRIGRTRNVKD